MKRWGAALLFAAVVPVFVMAISRPVPYEDSAMLMRYVVHAAAGHGLVWNRGDAPADGATDLAPTLIASVLVRVGLDAVTAVRLIALVSHAGILLLLWSGARRANAPPWLAFALILPVAWGPGAIYANTGFLSSAFACAALGLLVLGSGWRDVEAPMAVRVAFPLLAVFLGMIRPEGVLLSGLIVLAVALDQPNRARALVATAALAFGTIGLAYFLGRWWYFGHPLPTPYYKKGGFGLHRGGLMSALEYGAWFLWPLLLPAIAAAHRSADARHRMLVAAVPVVGFLSVWLLMSDATNFDGRFQYAVLPLLSWSLVSNWRDWWPAGHHRLVTVILLMLIVGGAVNLGLYWPRRYEDGRETVAKALRPLGGTHTMVVTEAGLLPFYSEWRAVDAWGLNDVDIARHGLTRDRLDQEQPDLIQFHSTLRMLDPSPPGSNLWEVMMQTLVDYARQHHYIVAAFWAQTPVSGHAYLVRPDAPGRDQIIDAVRTGPYGWLRPRSRNVIRRPRELFIDFFTGAYAHDRAHNLITEPRVLQ